MIRPPATIGAPIGDRQRAWHKRHEMHLLSKRIQFLDPACSPVIRRPRPITYHPCPYLQPSCNNHSAHFRTCPLQPRATPSDGKELNVSDPLKLNIATLTTTLVRAQKAWDAADKDKSGSLNLDEVVSLLNGSELRDAVRLTLNVEPKMKTEAEVKPLFDRADRDKSGNLSRTEFLALFLSVVTERFKANPLVLAEALLGFIDVDRNGKIEGGELKILLAMLGFPAALLMPIPSFIGIDYRGILKTLGGGK